MRKIKNRHGSRMLVSGHRILIISMVNMECTTLCPNGAVEKLVVLEFPFRIDRKDRLLTKVSYSGAMRLACTTVSTLSISRITARSTCFGEAGMVFGELS